jgi:hypothetical protein
MTGAAYSSTANTLCRFPAGHVVAPLNRQSVRRSVTGLNARSIWARPGASNCLVVKRRALPHFPYSKGPSPVAFHRRETMQGGRPGSTLAPEQ